MHNSEKKIHNQDNYPSLMMQRFENSYKKISIRVSHSLNQGTRN